MVFLRSTYEIGVTSCPYGIARQIMLDPELGCTVAIVLLVSDSFTFLPTFVVTFGVVV